MPSPSAAHTTPGPQIRCTSRHAVFSPSRCQLHGVLTSVALGSLALGNEVGEQGFTGVLSNALKRPERGDEERRHALRAVMIVRARRAGRQDNSGMCRL